MRAFVLPSQVQFGMRANEHTHGDADKEVDVDAALPGD